MRNEGYTLVEILLALVLVGILATLTAPSLRAYMARHRVQSALNLLVSDIHLTRGLAMRSGEGAVLRFLPSADCPAGAGHAYTVALRGAGSRVVRRRSARVDGRKLCLQSNASDSIAFNSRGLPVPFANRTVRAFRGTVRDSLTVSVVGRVYRRF